MRYLKEKNTNAQIISNNPSVNQDDIDTINARITNLENKQNQDEQALSQYKHENEIAFTSNNITGAHFYGNTIEVESGVFDVLNTNSFTANTIYGHVVGNIHGDEGSIKELTANNFTTTSATIDDLKSTTIDANSITVENLTVTGNVQNTGTTTYDEIISTEGSIDSLTTTNLISTDVTSTNIDTEYISSKNIDTEYITAPESTLRKILNEQIYHSYWTLDLLDPDESTGYNVISIPYFTEGNYTISLRDRDTDEEIFSTYITNPISNTTIAYSRKKYETGEPYTLLDIYVTDYHNRPEIYFTTQKSGIIYYHYEGRDELDKVAPTIYTELPFDVSTPNTLHYITHHRAATLFTHHLDYGDNTLPPGVTGTLFLIPSSDFSERTIEDTEYDTKSDVPFYLYVPDQSLNTDDDVEFKNISITNTTNLNGNVLIQNNTDETNPAKVENIDIYTENYYENTDSKTVEVDSESLTYNNLILVGHTESEEDYHLHIYDNVEIGEASDPMTPTPTGDRHNLLVHGDIIGDVNVGGEDGNALRIRQDENGVYIKPEPIARVDNALVSEDRVLTADVLTTYNGIANPRGINDDNYDEHDNYYPIEHLNNNTQVHGNLHIDNTTTTDVLHATRADISDLYITENALFDKTVGIRGDLVVDGSIIATDEKTIATSSDYVVLRQNNPTGLSATEQSGLVVHNYDGNGSTATIASDNTGTFRVSDTASEHTDVFTNILYYNGTYTDSTGEITIPKGITTSLDEDTLDDVVLYNDSYYHYNGHYYLVDITNKLTYDENAPITDTDLITQLDSLDRYSLTYYRSLSITTIDNTQNQPILTRAEESDLVDKVPLMWDSDNKKAISIINEAPEKRKLSIVSDFDQDGNLFYRWGKSGGGSGTVLRLTKDELDARLLITNPDDDDFIPDGSLIVITDDEQDYVEGEEI